MKSTIDFEKAVQNQKIENILDKFGNTILRTAYSYLHNMDDAEEVVQEVIIKYLKANIQFENEEHKKAWLIRVAINTSKNMIKYNKIREYSDIEEENIITENNDLTYVWEEVKKLPEKYSEAIYLYYQEGYSTKEIAKILNKNESTIRSNLSRAREQLKNQLKEAYDFEI